MGYQVLARKYRPQRFADVAGQDHVTRTLLNALQQNRMAHGYIFSGHRGIGKTTIARILSQALNCREPIGGDRRPTPEPCGVCDACVEIRQGNAVDVIEIDAATNRGIDEIRELRDAARYSPARDRYKIYILDEAHQITEAAFNALLKTLEEPPAHVIFMMATTEPENIPQTIRSRCQHFSFHAVKFDDILAQLKTIAAAENVAAEEDALALLAEAGDGSMRDALSIMDQAIASAPLDAGRPKLSTEQIRELMGSVPSTVFEKLLESVAAGETAPLMEQLNVLLNAGHSPLSLARQMVRYLRNALMAKLDGERTQLLEISADERARAARTALLFSEEELTRNLQIVLRTFDDLNYRQEQRFHLELGLLRLIHAQRLLPIEELLSGVTAGAGTRTAAPSSAPRASAGVARPGGSASASASPLRQDASGWSASPTARQNTSASGGAVMSRSGTATESTSTASVAAPELSPFPAVGVQSRGSASAEILTEGALAKAPETAKATGEGPRADSENLTADSIRQDIVASLATAGHSSAAQLLGNGAWRLEPTSVQVTVPGMGKKMLSLTVNAAAEKIVRQELQRLGAPSRFLVSPGEGATPSVVAAPLAPAGSVQEAALQHPMVKRAQEIFKAEVRSVVDLRQK